MNPFSLLAIGTQVFGGLFQASAAQREAQQRQQMFNYKAQLNLEEAARVEQQTKEQLENFDMQIRMERGQNLASISANQSGASQSARAILRSNAELAAKDKMNIELAGDRRAEALREEARLNRMGGESARQAGESRAAGAILSTVSNVMGEL